MSFPWVEIPFYIVIWWFKYFWSLSFTCWVMSLHSKSNIFISHSIITQNECYHRKWILQRKEMCSNMLMYGLSHLQVEIQVISGTWVWALTHDSLTCEIHLLIIRSRRVLIQIAIGAHAWKAKTNSNRLPRSELCYCVIWVKYFLQLTQNLTSHSHTHFWKVPSGNIGNSFSIERECGWIT